MNPFEMIQDDEVLFQMCQGWDTPTLLNMSQAYSRVYQVCEKEIKKRTQKTLKTGTAKYPGIVTSSEWIKFEIMIPPGLKHLFSAEKFVSDEPLYVYLGSTVWGIRNILGGRYYYPPHKLIIEFLINGEWTKLPLDKKLSDLGFEKHKTYNVRLQKS